MRRVGRKTLVVIFMHTTALKPPACSDVHLQGSAQIMHSNLHTQSHWADSDAVWTGALFQTHGLESCRAGLVTVHCRAVLSVFSIQRWAAWMHPTHASITNIITTSNRSSSSRSSPIQYIRSDCWPPGLPSSA